MPSDMTTLSDAATLQPRRQIGSVADDAALYASQPKDMADDQSVSNPPPARAVARRQASPVRAPLDLRTGSHGALGVVPLHGLAVPEIGAPITHISRQSRPRHP